MTLSFSPDRDNLKEESKVSAHYATFKEKWMQQLREAEQDPAYAKHNLEYDLRSTNWILEKVRSSDDYATSLYAALCNNDFQKQEVFPILRDQTWSCTFRYAGGIIADMRGEGSYIDWYCSGPEGHVTDEIRNDLAELGWAVVTSELY
jgi:hypothetical protein